MPRAIIGGIVAAAIVAMTIAAYVVTTSRLENRIEKDVRDRVARAQHLLVQNTSLEALSRLNRVEVLAANPRIISAAKSEDRRTAAREAGTAFRDFVSALRPGEDRPDIMAVIDANGDLLALGDVVDPPKDKWKSAGELIYPALALALGNRQVSSEVWVYEGRALMRVGVAPVIDGQNQVAGAVVLGFALAANQAQDQAQLLGTDVAYFFGDRVFASSFTRGQGREEATEKQEELTGPLQAEADTPIGQRRLAREVVQVSIAGTEYLAAAAPIHPLSRKPLPDDYPGRAAGAMVLISLDEATAPVGTVRWAILLLGLGALVVALLGMVMASKRILTQVDEIEIGINEIINGNLERTFRPVGSELDGLANGLNVMLARLLGRPEPGEEEYDEHGNVIQAGRVDFDTGVGELSAKDEAVLALAQEPEPDYYKRLYEEFVAAKQEVGEPTDNLTFDSFVAKLRLNEGNLRSKYQSRAVRFRVVITPDRKVTLKPVPIV